MNKIAAVNQKKNESWSNLVGFLLLNNFFNDFKNPKWHPAGIVESRLRVFLYKTLMFSGELGDSIFRTGIFTDLLTYNLIKAAS